MKRRTFIAVAASILVLLLTTACNDPQPKSDPGSDANDTEIETGRPVESEVSEYATSQTSTIEEPMLSDEDANDTEIETGRPVEIEISEYAPFGTSTIEELILSADVVAIASLVSVTSTTLEGKPFTGNTEYKPLLIFEFRIHEYLKGHGEDIVKVDVIQCCGLELWYIDRAAAISAAKGWNHSRDAERDSRPAVVFLTKHQKGDFVRPIAGNFDHYEFTAPFAAAYADRISIESTENKPWLPSSSPVTGAAGLSFDDDALFLTKPPSDGATGSSDPDSTVSLGYIRSQLNAFAQAIKSNKDVPDYEECLQNKFYSDRQKAAAEAEYGGTPFSLGPFDLSIESGLPMGTNLMEGYVWGGAPKGYPEQRLTGKHAVLFENWIHDPDETPENGWQEGTRITRPLAAGVYKVFFNSRGYYWVGCDHWDEDADVSWVITVTTTRDVVHEAFFDPGEAENGEAGYDYEGVGVISPETFELPRNGGKMTVDRIVWYEDSIEVEFQPHADLSLYEMHIIELDATRSLILPFGSARVRGDGDNRSYVWDHCDQPWHDGDQLMIRIREAGATGAVGPSVYPRECRAEEPGASGDASPMPEPTTAAGPEGTAGSAADPAAPSIVDAEEEGKSVELFWAAPETDVGTIVGYRIYRVGPDDADLAVIVENTGSTATSYLDDTLDYGTTYRYAVAAVLSDGSTSAMSSVVSVTTNLFAEE